MAPKSRPVRGSNSIKVERARRLGIRAGEKRAAARKRNVPCYKRVLIVGEGGEGGSQHVEVPFGGREAAAGSSELLRAFRRGESRDSINETSPWYFESLSRSYAVHARVLAYTPPPGRRGDDRSRARNSSPGNVNIGNAPVPTCYEAVNGKARARTEKDRPRNPYIISPLTYTGRIRQRGNLLTASAGAISQRKCNFARTYRGASVSRIGAYRKKEGRKYGARYE